MYNAEIPGLRVFRAALLIDRNYKALPTKY